ncbi:MAG: ThiF family adenylyltransferase [Thermoplasmata archaeon]|nr:ThiF family adenylyltransferase [Thermoplasmata archaeon]
MDQQIRVGFEKDDRLDRSRRIEWLDTKKISESSALVLGAGAIGNEVVKNLILSGMTRLAIVDFDIVQRSNLARCVFFTEIDALQKSMKAEALARAASSLVPGTMIEPVIGRVEDLPIDLYKKHDIVLGCLDNFNARLHANSHSRFARVPYIDSGMQGAIGKVFVSLPNGPCLECASNITHSKIAALRYSCTGTSVSFYMPLVPAEITTTSIVSAMAVREGLRLLSSKAPPLEGQMIYYDGLRSILDIMQVDIDPNCPNHS